jgi:hypothetical protein
MIRHRPCLLFHYDGCCCIVQQWPCLLFYYAGCYCITRHSPCLHSLHLLGGTEEIDWYPSQFSRIWIRDPSYTRRECYLLCRDFRYCVRRIYRQEYPKPTEVSVFALCTVSPPCSEVNIEWRYTFTSLIYLYNWYRDNFTFYLCFVYWTERHCFSIVPWICMRE